MIQQELYNNLLDFDIDDPEAKLSFSMRLAREQDWDMTYTLRAIEEYKRFMYLIVGCKQTCSPSVIVDEVWHLHLIYTRSYWEDFCEKVLKTKVHHHPTTGGSNELNKHVDLYAKTLELYQEVFHEVPPPDIWLPSKDNFRKAKQSWTGRFNLISRLKTLKK